MYLLKFVIFRLSIGSVIETKKQLFIRLLFRGSELTLLNGMVSRIHNKATKQTTKNVFQKPGLHFNSVKWSVQCKSPSWKEARGKE